MLVSFGAFISREITCMLWSKGTLITELNPHQDWAHSYYRDGTGATVHSLLISDILLQPSLDLMHTFLYGCEFSIQWFWGSRLTYGTCMSAICYTFTWNLYTLYGTCILCLNPWGVQFQLESTSDLTLSKLGWCLYSTYIYAIHNYVTYMYHV